MNLAVGVEAPDFTYMDGSGAKRQLHTTGGKKVVFFFPKAFTRGCTKESISIQENYTELKNLDVSEVFGISLDPIDKLQEFCSSYNFEYIMVSDEDKKISKKYGVYRNRLIFQFSDRDTFIVDEKNIITKIFQNGLTGRKSKLGLHNQGIEILNFLKDSNGREQS